MRINKLALDHLPSLEVYSKASSHIPHEAAQYIPPSTTFMPTDIKSSLKRTLGRDVWVWPSIRIPAHASPLPRSTGNLRPSRPRRPPPLLVVLVWEAPEHRLEAPSRCDKSIPLGMRLARR